MKIFGLISFLLLSITAFSQYTYTPQSQYHFQNKPLGFITSLQGAPPGQIGSFYVHEEFNPADIYLKDSTKLDNVFVRIDAKENLIEIRHQNTIKVLPVTRVMLVTVNTATGVEKFINGDLFPFTDNLFKGKLLQIHYEGNVSLLSRIQPTIKEANTNPNPMVNIGSQRDDEIILKTLYLIAGKRTFIDASQPKSKFRQKMITVFGDDVESQVKKTNNKDLAELSALVMELDNRSKLK
jgi:hypothetical protein